ncbi:MAG: hypothetical protein K0R72_46 [Clostridia bacterium]|jgi:uncharacterized protein (DUF362 family)/NAD-dependent dihydropyrimidine dehydrogenase PreA subunit|nr:hypothetical protein [Clostridia bacterium]
MVGIYKCETYDEKLIDDSIQKIFFDLKFNEKIISGMNVVLKPNLLAIRDENTATTTHHLFTKCVAKKVVSLGAKCIICDSPPGKYSSRGLSKVYEKLGYSEIEDTGAILNLDTTSKLVNISGKFVKNIEIINPILNADLVINLPKLKTHAMMNLTCAVKNLFGIVPGERKAEIHSIYPNYSDFADAIIDISSYVKNQITIVDAIYSMEGNGPNSGSPRNTGLVIASSNQFEIDYIASKLINLKLEDSYIVKNSIERGILTNPKSIEVVGEKLKDITMKDFKLPDTLSKKRFGQVFRLTKFIKPYPTFNSKKCIRCKLCIDRCPVNALKLINNKVVLKDKNKCIRCFCCLEHCPVHAVGIKHILKFKRK